MAEFFLQEFIVNIDVAIYQFVDSIMNPVLNVIMTFITHLGDTPGIIWFILGLGLLIPRKTRKLGVLLFAGLHQLSIIFALKRLLKDPDPTILTPRYGKTQAMSTSGPTLLRRVTAGHSPQVTHQLQSVPVLHFYLVAERKSLVLVFPHLSSLYLLASQESTFTFIIPQT